MKINKLREKLAYPFDGLRTETLDELENVVKDFSLSFISFLRENYSTLDSDYPYECYQLNDDFWQENTTGKVIHISKIFEQFEV